MKRSLYTLSLSLLGLTGVAGSVFGIIELRQAVSRSEDLHRLNTVGSQIEGDLEYQIQESRRAFLSALAINDPNQQLPYLDAARAADRVADSTLTNLRSLTTQLTANQLTANQDSTATPIQAFERSWNLYRETRDAVLVTILSGNARGAIDLDRRDGNERFAAAVQNLRALKRALEARAQGQSAQVDKTLRRCMAALAFFVVATFLTVLVLLRVNQARASVVRALGSTNQQLEHAQQLDHRRLSILGMVVAHAPLMETLTAIAELPAWCQPGAGAAIWSNAGDKLLYQVSFGLHEWLAGEARSLTFELDQGRLHLDVAVRQRIAAIASRAGMKEQIFPLQNTASDSIGLLLVLSPPQVSKRSLGVFTQMSQLASVAIENTLLYDRLAFQAQHDVLTGLPNRLLFQDRVQQAILRAQRLQTKFAVMWFDLDRFKQINDTLGHRIGDELLSAFARRLRSSLRASDTAARIGGDEFVILVPDLEDSGDARLVATKIIKSLHAPLSVSGHDVAVTATVGVSVYPEHGSDPVALMRNADLAMYQAKRMGRDTYEVFDQEFRDSLGRRVEIEQELKHGMDSGEFHMMFQPLIGRREELEGFEALLRWTNRKLGEVSPAEFIPIAEEAGLIVKIGEWVTRTVCRTGATWLEAGLDAPRIAVNASGLQIADPGFADMVHSALQKSGFPAERLEIEVTETALVGNLDAAIKQIARLRKLGIQFAIDDFGTGYSSLNRLRTLPVDRVKIDRSFIKDLERVPGDSATLVRGIIGLAHDLHLTVVAEGVETKRQLEILRSLGCDTSQGFFLQRPLSADDAELLMRGKCPPAADRAPEWVPNLVPEPSVA